MAKDYTPEQLAKFEQMAAAAGEAWQEMQNAIANGIVDQAQFDFFCVWYANSYMRTGHTNMGRNLANHGKDTVAQSVAAHV
jgi:hypothetical protein